MSSTELPFASVIVPVYNDAKRLEKCLMALEAQTYPTEHYEVIVVDNGSDDHPEHVIAQAAHARVIREEQPGSYAARNAGIRVAKGEIVAFTDADCIPDTHWLQAGVERLLQGDADIVGGEVHTIFQKNRPNACELYDQMIRFSPQKNKFHIEKEHFSVTANVCTRTSLFETERYFRSDIYSCGDMEWGNAMHALGKRIIYDPDVVVFHPARSTLRNIINAERRIAGISYVFYNEGRTHFAGTLRQRLHGFPFYPCSSQGMQHGWMGFKMRVCHIIVKYTLIFEWARLKLGGTPVR